MSNQSATYTLYLNSNVLRALQEHESAAISLDRRFEDLQQTLNSVGLAVGIHKLVEEGKEWIKTTAEYEQSLLRIKNNSLDIEDGLKNQQFILSEVDRYKIPLQEATDAYGDFLAMVKGSHLASDEVRKLHDEILMISKIKGISDGQMDAAVRNLGKMLEVGALDARHFFFFEQQLSGIGAYVAKQLGVSLNELALMRHKGELTGVDPKILLSAIEQMAQDEAFKLPEALKSTQSELNELSNEWLKFKTELVLDLKPEIIGFFHDLEDGIHWLKQNKEEIIKLGDVVITAGKAYLIFRAAKLALDTTSSLYNVTLGLEATKTSTQTSLIVSQTAATQALTIAIRELAIAQEMAAASSASMAAAQEAYLVDATGMAIYSSSQAAKIAALTEAEALRTGAMAATAGAAGMTAKSGALLSESLIGAGAAAAAFIAVVFSSIELLKQFGINPPNTKGNAGSKFSMDNLPYLSIVDDTSHFSYSRNKLDPFNTDVNQMDKVYDKKLTVENQPLPDWQVKLNEQLVKNGGLISNEQKNEKDKKDSKKQAEDLNLNLKKISSPSAIKGNSVTHITIQIGEMNGMKNPQFSVKSSGDMKDIEDRVGTELVKILSGVVNDSQQIID